MDGTGWRGFGCWGFGKELDRAQEVQCQEEVQGGGQCGHRCEQDEFPRCRLPKESGLIRRLNNSFVISISAMIVVGQGGMIMIVIVLKYSFGSDLVMSGCKTLRFSD